jgi:hypothetical protein
MKGASRKPIFYHSRGHSKFLDWILCYFKHSPFRSASLPVYLNLNSLLGLKQIWYIQNISVLCCDQKEGS